MDGEVIRSLDHLRAAIAEAYADDGEVTISYIRGVSLVHHDLKCNVKKTTTKTVGRTRRVDPDDDDRRKGDLDDNDR